MGNEISVKFPRNFREFSSDVGEDYVWILHHHVVLQVPKADPLNRIENLHHNDIDVSIRKQLLLPLCSYIHAIGVYC